MNLVTDARSKIRCLPGLLAMVFAGFSPLGLAQTATKPVTINPPVVQAPAAPAAASNDSGVRVLLVPSRETTLAAQMVGRLELVPSKIGQGYGQGETVIRFDCEEHQARLKMAIAEFNAAREGHEAKIRLQGLQSAGEVEVSLAAAQREKARAGVELSKSQLRECTISAPFAGRVVKLHVKRHQSVTVGTPLVDFVSSEPPKMRLNVPSKWLQWLKEGTRFEVFIDETGRYYVGKVIGKNARVDAVSQSIEVEAVVEGKSADLLPGMSGTATFRVPQ